MFRGLIGFPLTPRRGDGVDLDALAHLVGRAASAGVDAIGAAGSTGSYAYLSRRQRADVARVAVEAAGGVPVIVGVGAIGTAAVLENVADAESAGSAGVLLAPLSYQRLTDDDVIGLFTDVTERFPTMPVVLYDTPATTGFAFSDDLRVRIAGIPGIESIKLDSLPAGRGAASDALGGLRRGVPSTVSLGVSVDRVAAEGLLAGGDAWYSVLAGLFPRRCREIADAALAGDDRALELARELEPIWQVFDRWGYYRVIAALATLVGAVSEDPVYAPVRPLTGAARDEVAAALASVGRAE